MRWRRSTVALVVWAALGVALIVASIPRTSAGYVEIVVAWELVLWLLVALPLAAYWYTRRRRGVGDAPPLDPRDHWPPPPRR